MWVKPRRNDSMTPLRYALWDRKHSKTCVSPWWSMRCWASRRWWKQWSHRNGVATPPERRGARRSAALPGLDMRRTMEQVRHALHEYVEHYHHERNHQAKGNVLLFPLSSPAGVDDGPSRRG